jgi:drug/metabolite transporter (DMT)-like permease
MPKHPHLIGTLLGISSAVFYTATHVCLRYVAHDTEPAMTCAIRGMVAAGALLPWFVWRVATKQWPLPSGRVMLLLLAGFAFVQIGGNLSIQYAMAGVGLAVAVPVVYGVQLISSAIIGRIWLRERVPPLSVLAIGITITSVMLLSTGMESHPKADVPPATISYLVGFLAACLTGLAYATMSLIIRATVSRSDPAESDRRADTVDPLTIVFLNAVVATLIMSPLTVYKIGFDGILQVGAAQWYGMLGVGVWNLFALFSISSAMKYIKVVHANVINASQIAGCYLAGIFLFSEMINGLLLLGVFLTILGVLCVGLKPREKRVDR